ncbi:P-loop containing nucleoside triphosphate hydrolase protein [Hypoxylon sp. FL1284]|nr:P-loop containing nucleoside triphosphate hydrolase protein [Hypoxylon sp. FL1284]
MSNGLGSGSGSHIYGSSHRIGHDRHTQNIIDHTNTLFPELRHRLPRIGSEYEALTRQVNDQGDDEELDDFDRGVLGRPRRQSYIPNSDFHGQRLSLPHFSTPNHQRRVLGDASRYFGQPIPRDADFQSSFPSSISRGDRIEPIPASQSGLEREAPRRIREFRPAIQTDTSPFHAASNPTPTIDSSLSSSSPANIGASSPSTRLSLQRSAKLAGSPLVTHKRASNVKLNLEHAPDGPPVVRSTRLIDPRQALPDKVRNVFPYELFNVVQSKCFPLVYGTDDNVVVSAPTGSGKTAILEMAICKLVTSSGSENFKIVYQAPTKSLCSERAQDWDKRFSHMNLRCIELTGDTSRIQASQVGNASIIVTTPEKWDSITRKWSDHRKLLEMIRLVLIDEVHMLKDVRGATLEAVVSRMKTIGANVRFVALSATVPNIGDVAKWLGRDHVNPLEPARTETFGEELRPVKLQRYVYGYQGNHSDFIFESTLDGKLTTLLAKHSQRKPIMVFCFTRKSCERTAKKLAEWWSSSRGEDKAWPAPTRKVAVANGELQETVQCGVAFHHAGMDARDRSAVAQNFLDGQIYVICCTTTLAVGVNLPCHTVVLKGTAGYSDDGLQEYSDLEIMQMLGRAGRPQFDDSAVAIIMTRAANVNRYKKMISGDETLESTLHRNLAEHLNSEISLGTIQDVPTAKKWIGGTFLSVRVRQSPSLYLEGARNADDAEKAMGDWCERDIGSLQQYQLITEKAPFKCTEYGHAMSRYMVKLETMKLLLSIPRGAAIEAILKTLCTASEFKEFRFKPDERALFRELNKSAFILHHIKETITEVWHKVFVIVQVHLGCVELPGEKGFGKLRRSIAAEKIAIFDRLNRLVRCFVDCRAYDCDGLSTKAGLELARALVANSWEGKPSQLSQIPGSGPVTVRKWVSHGVSSVLSLADRDFQEIERISSRNPPYGMNMLKTLEKFPRLAMEVQLITNIAHRLQQQDGITVALKVNLGYRNANGVPNWNNKVPALTFMVLTTDGNLSYFWRGNMKRIDGTTGLNLEFPVVLTKPGLKISCYFSCEEIVGTQVTTVLQPDAPDSAFDRLTKSTHHPKQTFRELEDDVEYEGVADEDMLNALPSPIEQDDEMQAAEQPGPTEKSPLTVSTSSVQNKAASPIPEPMKMDNGRWMCKHACRNGGLTSTGKPCNHKCCHEGVKKPPARPRQDERSKVAGSRDDEAAKKGGFTDESSALGSSLSQVVDKSKRYGTADSKPTANHQSHSGHPKKMSAKRGPLATMPAAKRIRLSEDNEERVKSARKPNERSKLPSDVDALQDIDCIDLFTSFDDTTNSPGEAITEPPQNLSGSSWGLETSKNGSPNPSIVDYGEASKGSSKRGFADSGCTHSQYVYDESDSDDFPDLETILQVCQPKDEVVEGGETLYPGVVQTLKESMEYG